MDAGSGHGSAANGSAKSMEITGSGLVGCRFTIFSSVFTILCSSPTCLSLICQPCNSQRGACSPPHPV